MEEFGPIATAKQVSARIAEEIVDRIQSGALGVGAQLPSEPELARQFQVSRSTIREALGALQFVGYITSSRGTRKRVIATHPGQASDGHGGNLKTPAAIIALLEARLVLEPQVVALAALAPNLKALERAAALVRGMRLAVTDPALHAVTDLRLHRAICEICPNALLVAKATRLITLSDNPVLQEARTRAWADPEILRLWAHHHEEVLAAICRHAPQDAAAASSHHLRSVCTNVVEALALDGAPACSAAVARLQLLVSGLAYTSSFSHTEAPVVSGSRAGRASLAAVGSAQVPKRRQRSNP